MALAGSNSNRPYLADIPAGLPTTQPQWQQVWNAFQAWRKSLTAPKWIAPTLENGWVNYGTDPSYTYNPAGYYMDVAGRVWLRGLLKSGTVGTVYFTLPLGYRPSYRQILVADCNTGRYRIDVGTDGTVGQTSGITAGSNGYASIDGISFSTLP